MDDYLFFQSAEKWLSLLYPRNWEKLIVEGIPAFFDPEGNGALQIYALENKEKKYDLDEEMERYLAIHGQSGKEIQTVILTNEVGYDIKAAEFKKDDRFWIIFMISNKGSKMILATYNCDEIIDEMTAIKITNTISSIRIQ